MALSDNDQNNILKAYNLLLYFAGSMVMYEPVEECVTDFWSNGILTKLPVTSNNPRFIEAASQLRCSCTEVTTCKDMLVKDFYRLFSDPGVPLASPLKSSYIANNWKGESGHEAEKVSEFYDSYGWRYRSRYSIPDDNLGIELLFLTKLNDNYVTLDDEACRREMRNEIKRFIGQHLLSWLPEWNIRVQEYAGTMCYKGIATLIYAACEDIYKLLDSSRPSIKFTLQTKN
ncbi:MAG: molecular chaperone TorD family protein [Bacteroidota bacterium]|nr:molecular chaperone TorD family protein [Bacteroidota bacterium]